MLLVNGSPHKEGCTYTALCAVSGALNQNGIDSDVFWIGTRPLAGCTGCYKCTDLNRCVFQDTVNEFLNLAGDYDGLILGRLSIGAALPELLPPFWTGPFTPI